MGGSIDGAPAREQRAIFDVRNNSWYRCSPQMKCEAYDIGDIASEGGTQCGKTKCKSTEHCFTHRISPTLKSFHCVPDARVFVIDAINEPRELVNPWPLVFIALHTSILTRPRRAGAFL